MNSKVLKNSILFRLIAVLIVCSFGGQSITLPAYAQTQTVSILNLPIPGTLVTPTADFIPSVVKGIKVYPNNPLRFDFIIDTGHTDLDEDDFREESTKLIKYFMASLTVPEDDLWVNLSPYENERIIPKELSGTDMGRDMLMQDYILKQLTASLIYPEKDLGSEFWERVYAKAIERYGTMDISVNTFNKVWVVPHKATIYQSGDAAFIVDSHLKVMMDADYLALKSNVDNEALGLDQVRSDEVEEINQLSSQIIRELILPEIEKEINHGENFIALRQIYHSMVLATWFKRNLKANILNQVYVGENKINGIDIDDKKIKEKIYQQYLKAFEEGVYNYIKEINDPVTQEIIPKKYFSGGMEFRREAIDRAILVEQKTMVETVAAAQETTSGSLRTVSTVLDPVRNLDRLRRLLNVLAQSENVPQIATDAGEDAILDYVMQYLQTENLISETRDAAGDVQVIVIKDAVKDSDLGRAIKRWVMDPRGGVTAINYQSTDGIWKIVGFESDIEGQLDLEMEEVRQRQTGEHWIVAYNKARQKLRQGDQQIGQQQAQEQFEVARRDTISASILDADDFSELQTLKRLVSNTRGLDINDPEVERIASMLLENQRNAGLGGRLVYRRVIRRVNVLQQRQGNEEIIRTLRLLAAVIRNNPDLLREDRPLTAAIVEDTLGRIQEFSLDRANEMLTFADIRTAYQPVIDSLTQAYAQTVVRQIAPVDISNVEYGFPENTRPEEYDTLYQRIQDFLRDYDAKHHLIDATDTEYSTVYASVREILDSIIQAAGLNPSLFNLYLADQDEANAFYVRGSNTFVVNLGLLRLRSQDGRMGLSRDAIAFILAHEFQHLRQFRDDVLSGKVDQQKSLKFDWTSFAEDQRQQYLDEYDADWNALDLMSRAGFSVREASQIFRALLDQIRSAGEGVSKLLYLPFGDHPLLEPRTIELENLVLNRYWPNATAPISSFNEETSVNRSTFRDFQARASQIRSDEELAELILEAENIRELAVALSIGKSRRNAPGFEHRIDPTNTRMIFVNKLMNLAEQIQALGAGNQLRMSEEEVEVFQKEVRALIENLGFEANDEFAAFRGELSRGEQREEYTYQDIAVQTQTGVGTQRKFLTGGILEAGTILIIDNTPVIITTGEVLDGDRIEVVSLSGLRTMTVGTRALLRSRKVDVKLARESLSTPAIASEALNMRMSQLIAENPQQQLQLDFYREMFNKFLDRSAYFSARTPQTVQDRNPITLERESREIFVADPAEFDAFVADASVDQLLSALDNLLPTWIQIEEDYAQQQPYKNFLESLRGTYINPRGDIREFVDAILREVEARISLGEVSGDIILDVIAVLDSGNLGAGSQLGLVEEKMRLFTTFIQPLVTNQVAINRDNAESLTQLLDTLDFLSRYSSFFRMDGRQEEREQMQDQIAELLYRIYSIPATREYVTNLFQSHVRTRSRIKDKFYQQAYEDLADVDTFLQMWDALGRDANGLARYASDLVSAPSAVGEAFFNDIVSEIVSKQPTLLGLTAASDRLRRLVSLIHIGAISQNANVIFQAYDAEARELLLDADDLSLFREYIDAELVEQPYAALQGQINMDGRNQLLLVLGLAQFLTRNNLPDALFRVLLSLDGQSALGGFSKFWEYTGQGTGQKTAEGLQHEKDMRTFAMFLGELLNRKVDDLNYQMMARISRRPFFADKEEGYSVEAMAERLDGVRPQSFGRWDLMQDGDKDHFDYFSFLTPAYDGVSFQAAAADLGQYLPESRLRDVLIYILFVQKVLQQKAGVSVDSDRLFDFEYLREQVNQSGINIDQDLRDALAFLGWDRDIQKLNAVYLGLVNDRRLDVDQEVYESEQGDYADVTFYDVGGLNGQLALGLASLNEGFLRDSLESARPLQEKRELIIQYLRKPSAFRDQFIQQVLDQTLRLLQQGAMELTDALEQQIVETLKRLQNVALREQLAVQFLELSVARARDQSGQVSLNQELERIIRYLPDFSYTRDEVLDQFVNRHVKTTSQYQQVAPLFVQNIDNIRETENAEHLFWKEQLRTIFMNFSATAKTQFLLWMMGVGEKPQDLIKEEYRLKISFDGLRDSLGLHSGEFYKDIGQRDQQEFFNTLFLGDRGIFANRVAYQDFLDDLVESLIPEINPAVQEIFTNVLTTDDLVRRQRVLMKLMRNFEQLRDIENPEEREAKTIRVFLEANGLIGIKLGQFLAHSVLVTPGSLLQQELLELNDAAGSINKGILFDMLEKIYDGQAFEVYFESLDEPLGEASIKVVFKARQKDGTVVVIKFKRPEVDKLIAQDLLFLEDVLNRSAPTLQQEGIPVPAGLIKRLTAIFEEELNFGDLTIEGFGEANNQRRLQANIQPRRVQTRNGITYELYVPLASEVHENSIMVEEYADAIPLKDERALRAQGIDPDEVKQILMEELIQQFFFDGFYHADLHTGNVFVSRVGDTIRVSIIDVGAASDITAANREALVGILMALWDAPSWEANRGIVEGLFPAEVELGEISPELSDIVQSDQNPVQKLLLVFALMEKNGIEFQGEYEQFYTVIRFLKASEYLFTDSVLDSMRAQFFPADLGEIKARSSEVATRISGQFEGIEQPTTTRTAEQGLQISVTADTLGQISTALSGMKQLPFWSTLEGMFPQVSELADLVIAAVENVRNRGEDFELNIPRDKMAIYEEIVSDVRFLMGLFQQENVGPTQLMSALAAVRNLAARRNDIVDFILEQDLPIDELVAFIQENADANVAQTIRDLLLTRQDFLAGLIDVVENRRPDQDLAGIVSPQVVNAAANEGNLGGIDFNPGMLEIETQGELIEMDIPINPQMMQDIPIEGFNPVILQITPTNLPLLIGASEGVEKPLELSLAE